MEENNRKKISFGFSNDKNPSGSWEGIGIKQDMLLTDAEYYGIVRCGDENFVVAKVVEDEYGRYPELVNEFIVRRALAEFYPDGSSTLFLDQNKSHFTNKLEELLNSSKIKENIKDSSDIVRLIDGISNPNKIYGLLGSEQEITSTSITHEAFDTKADRLRRVRGSIIDMQETIEEQKIEIEELKKELVKYKQNFYSSESIYK